MQCSQVFECYHLIAGNKDEKHLPMLKVQHRINRQTNSRTLGINKSLSQSSIQSLSMAASRDKSNQPLVSAQGLEMIPERVLSLSRKKKQSRYAVKAFVAKNQKRERV